MDRLETERLILRPFRDGDAADLFEYAKDPQVGPIAGWPAHKDEAESLSIIRTVFAKPGVAAVALKESGKVVGSVGFTDCHYTQLPGPDNEVGYALSPAHWGCGLMTEAVRAVLCHGFERLGLETVWCNYYEGNQRSKRVIEKCGFVYQFSADGEVALMGETRLTHHAALTRAMWAKLSG